MEEGGTLLRFPGRGREAFSDEGFLEAFDEMVGSGGNNHDFVVMVAGIERWGADIRPAAVPEPSTIALVGLGCAGVGWARRRRRRANQSAASK